MRFWLGTPGGRGQDGQDGEHGGPGEDAPSVLVRVAHVEGSRPLLQIKVEAAGDSRMFVIDPNGGSLFIQAEGGKGGDGGHGGSAGPGGSGGLGKPNGPDGKPGEPGQGGRAGSGGAGALVEMIVDPKAERFLHVITFSCRGGEPGIPGRNGSPEGRWPNPRPAAYGPSAPAPVVRIQPVGPLL